MTDIEDAIEQDWKWLQTELTSSLDGSREGIMAYAIGWYEPGVMGHPERVATGFNSFHVCATRVRRGAVRAQVLFRTTTPSATMTDLSAAGWSLRPSADHPPVAHLPKLFQGATTFKAQRSAKAVDLAIATARNVYGLREPFFLDACQRHDGFHLREIEIPSIASPIEASVRARLKKEAGVWDERDWLEDLASGNID